MRIEKLIDSWNVYIAGIGSMLSAAGWSEEEIEAPIKGFSNFEYLEARAVQANSLTEIINAAAALAKPNTTGED